MSAFIVRHQRHSRLICAPVCSTLVVQPARLRAPNISVPESVEAIVAGDGSGDSAQVGAYNLMLKLPPFGKREKVEDFRW